MQPTDDFTTWLLGQEDQPDPVGELAAAVAHDLSRGVAVPVAEWPTATQGETAWRNYVIARHPGLLPALEEAFFAYYAEIFTEHNPPALPPAQRAIALPSPAAPAEPRPAQPAPPSLHRPARPIAAAHPHTSPHPWRPIRAIHFRPRVDAAAVLAQLGQAAAAASPTHGPAWRDALLAADPRPLELALTGALMSWLVVNELLPGTWVGVAAAPELELGLAVAVN